MVSSNNVARAAVLLAATATQVSALGSAVVHNQCNFPVYLWSVSETGSPMQTLPANGGSWSEQYRNNPDGGGISIKLGADTSCSNITQFEYTLDTSSLWYDLSNIDGYPFAQWGVTVVPTDSTCRGVVCPAGTPLCAAAYNVPSDNYATAECGSAADAVVVLCSGESDTSGSVSVTSVASAAASTVAASTAAPTSVVAEPTTTETTTSTTPEATSTTPEATSTTPEATSTTPEATSTSTTPEATSTTPEVEPTTTSVYVAPTSAAQSTPTTTSVKKTTHHSVHTYSHPVHHTPLAVQVPATTDGPVVPVQANPFVVIETTFVTHIVTVEARSPQPTAEVKRDAHHHHGHAAVHKEHLAPHHKHARNFARR